MQHRDRVAREARGPREAFGNGPSTPRREGIFDLHGTRQRRAPRFEKQHQLWRFRPARGRLRRARASVSKSRTTMKNATIPATLSAIVLLAISLLSAHSVQSQEIKSVHYTSPLPTGVHLDPIGDFIDLGSMPIAMALAPDGKALIVVLSGWREQGIQVVDLNTSRVMQTLEQPAAFYGLAFSTDGQRLYVSGGNDDSIFCYSWKDDRATFERKIVLGAQKPDKTGSKYPAGLAVSTNGRFLYAAENVNDTLAVVDPKTSEVVQRVPTDHYPYAVAVSGGTIYVSAWGGNTISRFTEQSDGKLAYRGRLTVGRHPSALLADAAGARLFVALAGSDRIGIIDTERWKVLGYLSDAVPASPNEGSTPNALALSANGSRLFVAEADNNAIAVFDAPQGKNVSRSQHDLGRLAGRIPTDWYPTALLTLNNRLLVLTGKGHGTHANPDGPLPSQRWFEIKSTAYTLGQLNGTLRMIDEPRALAMLNEYSRRTAAANDWGEVRSRKSYPPFKHVVYIIKENRTYDQVFGDLKEGDGDPSLVFFGREVSPNHHALALRFGLFDRFFTNAEVSSQGHIWSTAAYVTDFGEKTIPSAYSDRRAGVDGEEIDEPNDGFLWTLAAKKGVSFRDYGEMVAVPEGWPVTQRELGSDVSPSYPAFDLKVPDQVRADAWIAEFEQFVKDRNLPQLEILHLPSDHTAGARPGYHTPRAFMADNDLALGRIVEALSKSP